MSRLGLKSMVYHGDACLGELDVIPATDQNFQFPNNEIRIRHISPVSERCPPFSILQTVASFSVRCKLESSSPFMQAELINLHASCFHEQKTAVVVLEDEEIHLVAMPSKQKKFPCFWCYSIPFGLYASSLGLLNMRCLAIVFDLDETLIVANTMKSFEDRIDALRGWLARETDPVRITGMTAELKRYAEDRALLKQYTDNDCVMENGKMVRVQMEEVPQSSDGHAKVFRPIVRLQEKNIVLTRIKPEIRDTSVLVRLRPAWEDLRSYLTAKGRKRFEVFVCTMAEREYALEMWRLLDPESNLITSRQLQDRVVCVKSGGKKSLDNVFQDGTCHPKMAMVIDDRSKVWEERDQPRVHVVPPFTPYYAPQAEMANAVPVLCVARNVACNARGHFFKDFDENLLRKISDIFYEDDVAILPHAPDVSSSLIFEDSSVPNGNPSAPFAQGMQGAEVERRLNQTTGKQEVATDPMTINPELRAETSQASMTIPNATSAPMAPGSFLPSQRPGLLGNTARQDLNFPDKEQDMRRRFLNLRNQAPSEHPLLSRPPVLIPSTAAASAHGGLLVEEDAKKARLNNRPSALALESDASKFNKQRTQNNPFASGVQGLGSSITPSNPLQPNSEEVVSGHDQQKPGLSSGSQNSEAGASQNSINSIDGTVQTEAGKMSLLASSMYIGVLQEIGRRCSSKVEFRSVVSTRHDLQFSVEVLFTGEKIGAGMGKTRKDAQQQAALDALRSLAEKYVEFASSCSTVVDGNGNVDNPPTTAGNENGFLWDVPSQEVSKEEEMMDASAAANLEGGNAHDS